MPRPTVRLKPLRPERYGHVWIYDNELAGPPEPGAEPGDLVDVVDHNSKSLGAGYYNPRSKIPVRLLGAPAGTVTGKDFWAQRLARAMAFRARHMTPQPPAYRLIYGEADGFPGLVVDKYGDFLVTQFLTLGMELRKDEILAALREAISPRGIFDRSDSQARTLEGLAMRAALLEGDEPPPLMEIFDEDATILVDIARGAKTGLFLDQRANQIAAARCAAGRRVLNCFSYTGLFGLRAALAGAVSVTDVEISAPFQSVAQQQWQRNPVSRVKRTAMTENAFDRLRLLEKSGEKYDMVVLDPPAFTKSRAQREGALRGYNDINRRAIKLLTPGGILVTCSCSHHVDAAEFRSVVTRSARDATRGVRLIESRAQPPDHPVLLSVPESEYLKCLILEVE